MSKNQKTKQLRHEAQEGRLECYREELALAGSGDLEDGGFDEQWQSASGQSGPSGLGRSGSVRMSCNSSEPPAKRTKKELLVANKMLARGMLAAGIRANVLDCVPFREALIAIAQFGPGYKPMGRKTFYKTYCPLVRADLERELAKWHDILQLYGCTICTDGWKAVDCSKLMNGCSVTPRVSMI